MSLALLPVATSCTYVCTPSDVPASGCYFGSYEFMLRTLTPQGRRCVRFRRVSSVLIIVCIYVCMCMCMCVCVCMCMCACACVCVCVCIIMCVCGVHGSRDELSPARILLAGGSAGVVNWVVAIAPDTLKSRLQTSPPGMYSGIREVFTDMVSRIMLVLKT